MSEKENNELLKGLISYRAGHFFAEHPDKGDHMVALMRGWGFLIGGGVGALNLPVDKAEQTQDKAMEIITKYLNGYDMLKSKNDDLQKALEDIIKKASDYVWSDKDPLFKAIISAKDLIKRMEAGE